MNQWVFAGEVTLSILTAFFFVFAFHSLIEKEKRAFWRSISIMLVLIGANLFFLTTPFPLKSWLFGFVFVLFLGLLLFLIFSSRPRKRTEIVGRQSRVDERDVLFARFDLKHRSRVFNEYYHRRPENKKTDDKIRELPDILSSRQIEKNSVLFSLAAAQFDFLEKQLNHVTGSTHQTKFERSPEENTQVVKRILKYLGSSQSGICRLNPFYVYSHVGRGPEQYGREIKVKHKYAVVFAVEMDSRFISTAPRVPVIVETARRYVEAARISIVLSNFIRSMGYPARAHIAGSNYEVVLPPIAWEAGLGEVGRLGILITRMYGPRARLGLVTTDIPLIADEPGVWGIQNFCEKCLKCARNCPAKAIPFGEKEEVNGVQKWVLNREECYKFWRKAGTDCAVCILVCPYSKLHTPFHDFIRFFAVRSARAQRMFIWGDDLFYGRFPLRKRFPFPEV